VEVVGQQLNEKLDFSFNSGQCSRSTGVRVQKHKYAIYLHTLFMKHTNVSEYPTASSFRVGVFYLKDGGSMFIKTLVNLHQPTWRHVSKDKNRQTSASLKQFGQLLCLMKFKQFGE
jgi:hypothetical protein